MNEANRYYLMIQKRFVKNGNEWEMGDEMNDVYDGDDVIRDETVINRSLEMSAGQDFHSFISVSLLHSIFRFS